MSRENAGGVNSERILHKKGTEDSSSECRKKISSRSNSGKFRPIAWKIEWRATNRRLHTGKNNRHRTSRNMNIFTLPMHGNLHRVQNKAYGTKIPRYKLYSPRTSRNMKIFILSMNVSL
jgi:hypothetical protein